MNDPHICFMLKAQYKRIPRKKFDLLQKHFDSAQKPFLEER